MAAGQLTSTLLARPRITVLGSFQIRAGTNLLVLRTKKTAGVLAYLTASDRGATTDELIDVFWPSCRERNGRHSLAQALYNIRQVVGRTSIIGTTRLQMSKQAITADLWDFNHATTDSKTEEALSSFAPFLEDLQIDSPSFDAWKYKTACEITSRAQSIFRTGVAEAEQTQDWKRVATLCTLASDKLPFDPRVWEARICALLNLGAQSNAELVFDEYTAISGRATDQTKEDTWAAITARCKTAISPSGNSSNADTFVGRRAHLAKLTEFFDKAVQYEPQLVVVQGKAGIGKTALCERFCEWAFSKQAQVIRSTAYEAEQHIAYNVLADLTTTAASSTDWKGLPTQLIASLSEIVPEIDPSQKASKTPLGPEAAQRRLFEAATRLMWSASEVGPVLIFIDDVHWADETTLCWLNYFVRRTTDKPVLVLLAARSSVGQRHALTQLQQSNRSGEILHLSELDPTEVSELVKRSLQDRATMELVKQVVEMSGGHPLLLTEMLKTVSRVGECDEGALDLSFIQRSLMLLPGAARKLVEAVAVLGVPTNLTRLSQMLGTSLEVASTNADLIRDFCVFDSDNNLRFTHDLIRDAVRKTIPQERLQVLHALAAEKLEESGAYPAALAYHYDKCGERAKARACAIEAAAISDLRRAAKEADYYYEIAIRNSDSEEQVIHVKASIAKTLVKAGENEAAEPIIAELVRASEADPRTHLQWRHMALMNAHAMKSNLRSKSLLEEARVIERLANTVGDDNTVLDALRVQLRVETRLLGENFDSTIPNRLLSLSESCPVSKVGTEALRLVAQLMGYQGSDLGVKYAKTALLWAEKLDDTELIIRCRRDAAAVYYTVGLFSEAKEEYERALSLVQAAGAVLYHAHVFGAYASLLMELDCDDRTEVLLDLILREEVVGNEGEKITALCNRAIHAYQRGLYSQCCLYASQVLADEAEGMWLEIAVRGVWGLSLLEIGQLKGAKDQAEMVEALMTQSRVHGDVSYGYVLIARVKAIQGTERGFITSLRSAISARGNCDPIGTSRIKLALAETLIRTSSHEALDLIKQVKEFAVSNNLKALGEQTERIRRKIRRSEGNSRPGDRFN